MDFLNNSLLTWLLVAGVIVILLRIFLKVAKVVLNIGLVIIALALLYVLFTTYVLPAL
jgi:hypothetical protein